MSQPHVLAVLFIISFNINCLGSKEVINTLHKCGHSVSYNDIRIQNQAWSWMVVSEFLFIQSFRKVVTTHSTIDNNDGREETMTGLGITHHTNITMFQLPTKKEKEEVLPLSKEINTFQAESNKLTSDGREISPFNIYSRVGPPLFKNFSESGKDLIETNFLYDLA